MDANECNNDIIKDEETSVEMVSSSGSDESLIEASIKQPCEPLSLPEEDMKLEGWLRLAGLGFRKTVKQVWFVYGDDTGKLYYYLQPQDLLPLGEIDLRHSSLTFDASNRDKPGVFEIRTGEKVYSIDALEHVYMFSWLDALQKKRRAFSMKQSELAKDILNGKKQRLNVSGLLGQMTEDLDSASIDNMDSLSTKIGNAAPTIDSSIAEKEAQDNASNTSNINGRPRPPSSIPLVNNFNTQWHVNFDESPNDIQIPSICSEYHTQSKHPCIAINRSYEYNTLASQSGSSQTLASVESKLSQDYNHSPVTSPVSPMSANIANGKLKFVSMLRNNFKLMKDTVKEKTINLNVKSSSTTQSPENAVNTFPNCCRCKALGDELNTVKEQYKAAEDELYAGREIAGLLQKEVDVMKALINTRKECEGKSEEEIMQVLHVKDKYITELEHSRAAILDEKNMLVQELRQTESTLKDLRDQICMFQQTLVVKDEIIISLTNINQELKNNNSPDLTDLLEENNVDCFPFSNSPTSVAFERKEIERLTDMCKAYEDQNKFLTNEIIELNTLRQDDEARERLLKMSVAQSEAQYFQTRSKYLYLLNEIQTPVRGGEEHKNQEIVNQLLEEAIESETESQNDDDESRGTFKTPQGKEYDCYGFLKFGHEDGNLLASRASILQKQYVETEYKIRDSDEETSKRIKWENFMVGMTPNKHLVRSTDIKILLRLGIPHQFRERIWQGCINLYVRETRNKLGVKYYKDLEERANNNKSNPAIKQIELDLLRTLPDNKYFDKIDSPGIRKLRRVLLCYSIHNPCIGYCQGLNRLAAIALLFLCEEDAFWSLVAIIDHLMPADYYTTTLAAAQADQRVLKDLVQERCPKLYAHLEVNDADLSFFTFNWFLTVFVDGVYPELFLRIWDVFLFEGSKVLFRFALAFLKYGEDEILKQPNNLAINRYMRTLGETITDVKRIYNIAFSELNPFPMKSISNKRQYHLQQVKIELEEFEKVRRELRSIQEEEEKRRDKLDYFSDEEIDDGM